MKNKEKWIVSTTELAEIIGISDRRIQQLVKEDIISRLERGKFDLPTVIQEYAAWLQTKKENGQGSEYMREKTLLTRANRQKEELELENIKRELHEAKEVQKLMNHMIGTFRTRCLHIPEKVARQVAEKTELSVIQDIIKKGVYETLTELSNYDPA